MNFRQQIQIFNQNRQVSIQGSQFTKVVPKVDPKANQSAKRRIKNHFDINNSLVPMGPEKQYDDRIDKDLAPSPRPDIR